MQTTIHSFTAAMPWKMLLCSLLLIGAVTVFLPYGAQIAAAQDADAGDEAAVPAAGDDENQGGGDAAPATPAKKRGKSYLRWRY